MRTKSYYFLLIVLVLGLLSGIGYSKLGYKFGLDVQGGVRFTYAMDLTKLKPDQREGLPRIRERLVHIMGERAHGPLAVAEPVVVAKGEDQIVVELPGFSDVQKAQETMGSSARIEFYWAKNVTTSKDANRPYVATDSKDANDIAIEFHQKFGDSAAIKYGDPKYAQIVQGWDLILAGEDLAKAEPQAMGQGYVPLMRFSPQGAQKMETWSRAHANQSENLAAVLDGKVLSIAAVRDNQILSDNAQIDGTFPDGYVVKFCDLLNSGSLPVDLKLLSSERVDPSIGKTALEKIVSAGIVAFAIVSIFLVAYYAFPGLIAFIALSLYVLFTLTVLKLIGATFSLAGIAGFILSVGMAVDANILVFERFKEEVKAGRSLPSAIELGFRRALSAIIDSNACTILTSLVLVNLGTGPVKGFATTLIIGVVISLFTAVSVTRSLLMFFVGSGMVTNPKWFALDRNWFGKRFANAEKEPLRIVETSKKWFAISLITMVVSIPFFFMGGFRPNVEFRGGYEAVFHLGSSNLTNSQLTANLEKAGMKGGNVQIASNGNDRLAYITLPPISQLSGTDQQNVLAIATAAGLPADPTAQFTKIGPQIQKETEQNAVLGVLLSSGLIIVYLAFRFGIGFGGFAPGLRFGISAIGALIHDILVVFGTAAIVGFAFGWEVSALFLTAMLTIIGFSVHDTIVIFDRIRENLHKPQKDENFGHLVDRSITQSYARSINTSATVIVTLLILAIFGTATPDLKFFVVSMLIGILSGTYSSIYNASPILYLIDRRIARTRGEEFSLVGMANQEVAKQRVVTTQSAEPAVVSASGRSYGQVRRRANQTNRGPDIEE